MISVDVNNSKNCVELNAIFPLDSLVILYLSDFSFYVHIISVDAFSEYEFNGTCYACPMVCHTCLSQDICKSCNIGELLYQHTCVNRCPEGWFEEDGECKPCHVTCASCNGQY